MGQTIEKQYSRQYPWGTIIYTMSIGSDRYRHTFRMKCTDPFVRDSIVYRTNTFVQKQIRNEDEAWEKAQLYAEKKIKRIHNEEIEERRTLVKRWENLETGEVVKRWRWVAERKKIRKRENKVAFQSYLEKQPWSYWFTLTYSPHIPTTLFNYWRTSNDLQKIKSEKEWDTLLNPLLRTKWDWVEDMERFCYQLSRTDNVYRVVWCVERHKSGVPHIHGMIWSSAARNKVDLSYRDGNEWRQGNIERAWKNVRGGRVDVQRIEQNKKGAVCNYITKYVSKDFGKYSAGITWDIRTIGRNIIPRNEDHTVSANVEMLLRQKYKKELEQPKREKFAKIIEVALTNGTRAARKIMDKREYDFEEVLETDCGTLEFLKNEQEEHNGYTPTYDRGFEYSSRI